MCGGGGALRSVCVTEGWVRVECNGGGGQGGVGGR